MLARLLFAIILFAGGVASAATSDYARLSQNLVSEAAELIKERAEEAERLLNLALTANPANPRAYILKGEVERANGDAQEGLRLIAIGLEIDPQNLEGLILQGEAALDAKEFETAQKSFAQVARLCISECQYAEQLVEGVARMNNLISADNKKDE